MKQYEPKSVFSYIPAGVANSGIIYQVPQGRKAKLMFIRFWGNTSAATGVGSQSLKLNSTSLDRENELFYPLNYIPEQTVRNDSTSSIYSTSHLLGDIGIYLNAGDYLSLTALSTTTPASVFISLIEEYEV